MQPKKIFLISIDTLRADRLGCYGYGKDTSPNLDRLAEEGVVYPNAFSPCPYTIPTHTSLLTGIYPANNVTTFAQKSGKVDPDGVLFLQEILAEQGYATGAFVSCFVLRKDWGLNYGFDVFDDQMTSYEANRPHELIRHGKETTAAALKWIRANKDRDFFIWLHYFDVHGPYDSNGPFEAADYGDSPVLLSKVRDGLPGGIPEYQLLDAKRDENGKLLDYQKDQRYYLACYDNGVKYQDAIIGELFESLKNEGIYDDSMIIVTADHGEALGESGVYFFHGLTVTPEQSRVPLIIKYPFGTVNDAACLTPVSTVDIMPTILEQVGFPFERLGLDGLSLHNPDPDRFVLSENEWQRAVIWRDYYMLREKEVFNDGFYYYFDSQSLCRGSSLFDYKKGHRLPLDQYGPAERLIRYSEELKKTVDPKEKWLKEKDRIIADKNRLIAEKDRVIAGKDGVIAEKDEAIACLGREIDVRGEALARLDNALSECRSKTGSLEAELESVYNSKSWKLTYPVRWVSARLKGRK